MSVEGIHAVFEPGIIPAVPASPPDVVESLRLINPQAPTWFLELLVQRGVVDKQSAWDFLKGSAEDIVDPLLLTGMESAVQFLRNYYQSGKLLCIFGDYDLDGISGTALLMHALRRYEGWNLTYRLPSRFEDGYGLSLRTVEKLAEEGVQGLVLVDTGITATKEIERARELGIEVMIVDHHRPPDDGLPIANAILDPFLEGCQYPHQELSAVGVAWKLVQALYTSMSWVGADDFMDLVTLGTLSDMMPMGPENRWILRTALARMPKSQFPGVRALCEEVADSQGVLGSQDILFRIAPLLNAPGRLEHPGPALELLLSKTEGEAVRWIRQLREMNDRRREVEQAVTREAVAQAQSRVQDSLVLVVDSPGWHLGVLGIVASKLVQQFGRPAAVVSHDEKGFGSASVRGVPGFNWHLALSEARDYFERWGGHQNAAGFSVKTDLLSKVREEFEASAKRQEYAPGVAAPIVECHAEVRLADLRENSMEWLRKLEPYGRGNPAPVFVARQVRLPNGVREVRGGHLQFEVSQETGSTFSCIAFGLGHAKSWLEAHAKTGMDLAFVPNWNSFRGRRILQLQIRHVGVNSGQ